MYQDFATNYDEMMREIPYEEWFSLVREYLQKAGIQTGKICELGCGTGILTEKFHEAGYEMIGVDLSAEMLMQAKDKNPEIFYVQQDMTELALGEPMDAMISLCDSMNYLTTPEEMAQTLQRVEAQLKPGGLFVFDLKTEYCYRHIIGDRTMVEEEDHYVSIWENTYFEDEKINQYALTIFQKQPDSELYHRAEEVHHQRAYSPEEMKELLRQANLTLVECLGEGMQPLQSEEVERFYIVARKSEGGM